MRKYVFVLIIISIFSAFRFPLFNVESFKYLNGMNISAGVLLNYNQVFRSSYTIYEFYMFDHPKWDIKRHHIKSVAA